jgi:hypothetical protein
MNECEDFSAVLRSSLPNDFGPSNVRIIDKPLISEPCRCCGSRYERTDGNLASSAAMLSSADREMEEAFVEVRQQTEPTPLRFDGEGPALYPLPTPSRNMRLCLPSPDAARRRSPARGKCSPTCPVNTGANATVARLVDHTQASHRRCSAQAARSVVSSAPSQWR